MSVLIAVLKLIKVAASALVLAPSGYINII